MSAYLGVAKYDKPVWSENSIFRQMQEEGVFRKVAELLKIDEFEARHQFWKRLTHRALVPSLDRYTMTFANANGETVNVEIVAQDA
jgi:hypothetical protein